MRAKDIMTTDVVSVRPETTIAEIAQTMLERHVSGLPVIDADGKLVGMVSEGDLMHRREAGTLRRRPWWLQIVESPADEAEAFAKEHGRTAGDVMTGKVVTIDVDMPVAAIAELLESNRIKRVPVVDRGDVVGIVSRANLLQALVTARAPAPARPASDNELRQKVIERLSGLDFASHGAINPIVNEGVVELWGWVDSAEQRKALCIAAEEVAGVKKVVDHLGSLPPWAGGV